MGLSIMSKQKSMGRGLASYETDNYRADPCRIDYTDGNEPVDDFGYVFKFVGNVRDLAKKGGEGR